MRKTLRIVLSILFLLPGIFFGILSINRAQFDYSSEGKYFDQASLMVYDQDSLLVFGILATVFLLIGLVLLFFGLQWGGQKL